VADYGVNIAVAVKNTQAITKLSRDTDLLGQKIRNVNDALEKFGDLNGSTVVNSVKNFNKELAKAAENFNSVKLGSDRAADAARNFARAQDLANGALREQAALLAQVRNEGRSGTLRGGTQYSGPIGPGFGGFPARKPEDISMPMLHGQSSAISGLLERNLAIQRDSLVLEKAFLDLEEKQAGRLNEQLRLRKSINAELAQEAANVQAVIEKNQARQKFLRGASGPLQTPLAGSGAFGFPVALSPTQQERAAAAAAAVAAKGRKSVMEQLAMMDQVNEQLDKQRKIGLAVTAEERKQAKARQQSLALQQREERTERAIAAAIERGTKAQERRQKFQRAVGSGLIGGAFPLLFGQGIAPAIGGGLGGFAGGLLGGDFGFGLGLVGTQLGAIFQQAQDVAAALGKAFRTGEQAAQALEDAVGSLNKETENYINNLEQSGQLGRQQEAILEVLEEKFGSNARTYLESAKAADRFKKSTDDLFRSLQRLFIPATVEFNALTDGPLIEEPTPELTKAAERRIELLKGQLDLENLITAEKSLQGEKNFELVASVKKQVAEARFQLDFQKLQNKQLTGQISDEEYNISLKIRQTQLGRELTEIERQRADAVKKSAEAMERLVDEMVRGVNQAAAPGASMAKALKEENQFLQNAVKFGVEAAEDIRQISRTTLSGGMSAQEAMDLVEQNRQLKEILKSRKELNKGSKVANKDGKTLEQSLRKQLARYEEIDPFMRKRNVVEADHLVTLEKIAEVTDKTKRDVLETLAGKVKQARLDDIAAQKAEKAAQKADKRLRERLNAANTRAGFQTRLATAQAGLPGAFDGPFGGSQRTAFLGQQEIDLELQTKDLEIQDAVARGLAEKAEKLKAARDEYELYETQILEATVAQEKFNEALALTQPVTDSLFDSLMAVADGTKSAQEAFADFLRSIASMLADAAKQMIATYIAIGVARMFAGMGSSGGGGELNLQGVESYSGIGANTDVSGFIPRANGGAVGAGRPYLVGERGPELFVPGAQGNIVPNNAMGGANVTVNVDASGSSVQGDSQSASQLGKAIGAAVQAELIKQKRPGGLLTR
tara:strand:- start:32 stop:3229 length:3198 start_codon:yes stop_codon:yes gene_type:complete